MALTMHQSSVFYFTRLLNNLSNILAKAQAHADETGTDPKDLLEARLAEDMFNLSQQIQMACLHPMLFVAGITGKPAELQKDEDRSFAELRSRISETISVLESIRPEDLNGSEDQEIVLVTPRADLPFTGQGSLQIFSLPNFFFHVVTAYDILRHRGVPLGKMDFLGGLK